MTETIRVLLVDDHDLVRRGLKAALGAFAEFNVVGEAADGDRAISESERLKPDLVVMDIRLPGMSGIEACREILSRQPDSHVLMLTSFSDERAVMAAIMAGAQGFMLKDVRTDDLVNAMRVVGQGGSVLDPAAAERVIKQIRRGNVVTEEDRLYSQLSAREQVILGHIAEGLTNREIADLLYLSEKTIKHHVSDVLSKLGMARRVDAAVFATRQAALHFEESPDEGRP